MVKTKSSQAVAPRIQTWRDAKTALLFVSVLINAFILVGWAVLKLTSQYDASLASTLLGR
jgi:hypothetical protein